MRKPILTLLWLLPAVLACATLPALPMPTSGTVADLGPQGMFIDLAGHDDNDDTVGTVTYNNQGDSTVHIESLYVHGVNITTQGRFEIDVDIQPGERKALKVIMRDVRGKKSKVFADIKDQSAPQ